MGVYDDAATFCDYSPTSTVSTSSTTSSGLASPVYENVEELTGLCSRSWKMVGGAKRNSKPSMSDFLAQLPPPPPPNTYIIQPDSSTSTASSSSSSRRPIISPSTPSPSPPPPHPLPRGAAAATLSLSDCSLRFDMRPLSLPHKEMQRIEREQSHRVLIITLLIITIFIVLIAFSIYMFFDEIEAHINNIADNF
uniref:Uncharacterized protein n=1 Tax=Caenorhabditis japonica TaxID=281687 RepID=A0A8R1DZC1_CAEJA